MNTKHYLKIVSVLLITFVTVSLKAQDIIIKTDKQEIKAKVLEIEEHTIKYKKFEFQDGPSYNINKDEVFMVIYKNGTRETFESKRAEVKAPVTTYIAPAIKPVQPVNEVKSQSAVKTADPETRVKYFPSRIWCAVPGPDSFSLTGEMEGGLAPNWANFGVGTSLSTTDNGYVSSSAYGFHGYLSGFLPLNRLLGNIENQDKGFFPFTRVGATFSLIDVEVSGATSSGTSFDALYALGVDYKFSRKFGLTIIISQFSTFGAGLNFGF